MVDVAVHRLLRLLPGIQQVRVTLFSLTAALALTACGSKPSDDQAKKAITAKFERVLGSQVWVKEYQDSSLSGCKQSEMAEGVVCDVGESVVLDIGDVAQARPFVQPVRFSKASGEWTAHTFEAAMTTRSYPHVGCATVLLGGAGLLFVAGGLEAQQQGAPLGWLAIGGGLATWAVLGFLYWINARAYRHQEEAQQLPYAPPSPKRGGFWKGFFVTWAVVVAIHMVAFLGMGFADLMPRPEQFRAVFSLLAVALVPAHVVAPVLGGVVYNLIRSTALR
nr:hypothetical protein [Stenotrophomonas geniculata]